ncbi:MAG: UPF0182 family protein [Syntrophobacteraceae bacterium]|nr:UPF0182 family protein [Syntrophobacteraceae bacterium]
MVLWKKRLGLLMGGFLGLLVLGFAVSLTSAAYLVDLWWYRSLGYEFYYWQRLLYRYVIFGTVTVFFFLIFFLNFWVASRHLGTTLPKGSGARASTLKVQADLLHLFRTGSMWVYTPLSLVLAIPIALPLFHRWEDFLLYLFAPSAGMQDPVFGKDVAFYLFSLPIYSLVQQRLFLAFALLLCGVTLLYWLERRLLLQQDVRMPPGAKWHLNTLVLLTVLLGMGVFVLERYELLYAESHEPLFFGPGYEELRVILPMIWLILILLPATAGLLVHFLYTKKNWKPPAVAALCLCLVLGGRYSPFLPDLVDRYIVKPNALSLEKPFIADSVRATLTAYDLDRVEVRDFSPQRTPTGIPEPQVRDILRNVPVWDGELLTNVYEQLQELRTYYDFSGVDVSRYEVRGNKQQVFLAARELNADKLPAGAHNWVNKHLTYTHGYGVVMTPAAQGGDEPMTWFIRGIPVESQFGFSIQQPGIYFGELDHYPYVIAPNDEGEFDYPEGNSNVMTHYKGKGGVPLNTLYKKLLFSWYLGDRNIFFTTKTNRNSKILFRRNIRERVHTLTPFLRLDDNPYIVVTPERLYWIQDAYTVSDRYPNAAMYEDGSSRFNYIRNSVKVVVDAYHGTVDYYIFDPVDPVIRSYSRIYPGVFKDKGAMPPELMSQVRYPQDLFDVQMTVYAKYHQEDPEVFYQQEDAWEFASTPLGKQIVPIKSYYLTLDLIERGMSGFLLLSPMSPKGKANLRALMVVGAEEPHYGKIVAYNFPKGELIHGPSQVNALIQQDTRVSEQFTLWDQAGSRIRRGKMIILPIGNMVIYIQPIYLIASTQLNIPELKRLIMTQGQVVVMEPSLEEAYTRLEERLREESLRIERRYGPALPAGAPTPAAPQP